jgi:hypothetical protein
MSQQDKKIDLPTAISWTSQYRTAPQSSAKAFLVPVQALQGLLAEMGNPTDPNACIRIYMGVDPSTNEQKLVLVGTQIDDKGVYRDLLPDSIGSVNSIYDFTKACPPNCDPKSPLN